MGQWLSQERDTTGPCAAYDVNYKCMPDPDWPWMGDVAFAEQRSTTPSGEKEAYLKTKYLASRRARAIERAMSDTADSQAEALIEKLSLVDSRGLVRASSSAQCDISRMEKGKSTPALSELAVRRLERRRMQEANVEESLSARTEDDKLKSRFLATRRERAEKRARFEAHPASQPVPPGEELHAEPVCQEAPRRSLPVLNRSGRPLPGSTSTGMKSGRESLSACTSGAVSLRNRSCENVLKDLELKNNGLKRAASEEVPRCGPRVLPVPAVRRHARPLEAEIEVVDENTSDDPSKKTRRVGKTVKRIKEIEAARQSRRTMMADARRLDKVDVAGGEDCQRAAASSSRLPGVRTEVRSMGG